MITLVLIGYTIYTVIYIVPLCLYYCPGKCVSHNLGDLHASGLIVGLKCRYPDQKTSGQNKHYSTSSSLPFPLTPSLKLFSNACLHCSCSNSSMSFSLAHSTTSSANIICQGGFFLMFSVSESTKMANRKGLKADPWWSPISISKG